MKNDNETYSALGEVGDFQQKRTRWARIRLDLAKSPLTARFGLLVILVYVFVALFAPFIAPYGEAEVFPIPYAPWSSEFIFGTDQIGRDVLSRMIYGTRNTVGIAVLTTILSFLIGGALGLAAAIDAVTDSTIDNPELDKERIGVCIGSGIGGLSSIENTHDTLKKSGPRRISPFFIPATIINMISGNLSIKYGFKGPNSSIVTACTTGTHNIGEGFRQIQYSHADIMLCGGAEMATTPLGIGGFAAARALSTRNDAPQQASRPWDTERDGFVLGDGAGVLVLEELELSLIHI